MSVARRQAQIDAPLEAIWELLGDPNRYPDWWPRIIETRCEGLGEGCTYKSVSKGPVGVAEETILIERLDDCREVRIRCLDTGTYSWLEQSVSALRAAAERRAEAPTPPGEKDPAH
jgi:hypothetical protein